jgi:uncharacterized protein YecE (DUF72 family)
LVERLKARRSCPRARWAAQIRDWANQGRTVFCYFDNDQKSAAPLDARRLMELLGQSLRS